MIYFIIVLVSFIHIGFMMRAGYDSKSKDKKRIEKLLYKIFYSTILASILTAFFWFIAPVSFSYNRIWITKIVFIFIPAYYFIGLISVFIGIAAKKLSTS
ncbi:hypothetical protein BH09PAT2_BH09PAT2_06510 [soil metagenome]